MYSVCLRYAKNKESAQDIFQEGFYLIYKNIHQLRNPAALSGWVKSIFINSAIEYFRKNKKVKFIEETNTSYQNGIDNWNDAISNLSLDEITQLIQELPTGCQTVFNMYVIDGYSHKEIAEALNISAGTSKSQLFDARKILKQWITENAMVRIPKTS